MNNDNNSNDDDDASKFHENIIEKTPVNNFQNNGLSDYEGNYRS